MHRPVCHLDENIVWLSTYPWVPTAASAPWLDALGPRVPWDRCGVAQRYVPSAAAVLVANAAVPGLGTQRPEGWYVNYVVRMEK